MRFVSAAVLAILLMAAQSESASKQTPAPDQIIQKFTQKETEFYDAWMQYMYTQTAVIRVLSVDGLQRNETMRIVSEVVFNDDGTREVRTVRTSGRLSSVEYSPEDKEVMENMNPFALTAKELPLYNLKYLGKEKADELDCYVFSVKPKSMKKGRMYFEGKIWVDDEDLQIVKTIGKPVPQTAQKQYPEFETIRQVVDDKYWFPVWTHADSDLRFGEEDPFRGYRQKVVHIEETITYDDYKRFAAKATILPVPPTLPEEEKPR